MALVFDRLNVLLIEDNAYMRRLVRDILLGFGINRVCEAVDGSEALSEMKTHAIDVVICDWMMEPLDGLDFVRLIRTSTDSPNQMVPIIMMTGHTERGRIIEARDAGVTEFLAKPVTPMGIYSRLRAVIESPRAFVRTSQFSGPDRRRKTEIGPAKNRRAADKPPR